MKGAYLGRLIMYDRLCWSGGCGNEWPACGGIGVDTYFNLANCLMLAINDGYNTMVGRYM